MSNRRSFICSTVAAITGASVAPLSTRGEDVSKGISENVLSQFEPASGSDVLGFQMFINADDLRQKDFEKVYESLAAQVENARKLLSVGLVAKVLREEGQEQGNYSPKVPHLDMAFGLPASITSGSEFTDAAMKSCINGVMHACLAAQVFNFREAFAFESYARKRLESTLAKHRGMGVRLNETS